MTHQSWIENQLRTAEQRDGLASVAMRHHRIPHLCAAPHMRPLGHTLNDAFTSSAEMVGLQFDGGEVAGALWKICVAAEPATGIGQCHHTTGMQEAIRCHRGRPHSQFAMYLTVTDMGDDDTQMTGQTLLSTLVEIVGVEHARQFSRAW